jgi:aspartyl-tRNA synthetase
MKAGKPESKIKSWFKNLFKKRSKSKTKDKKKTKRQGKEKTKTVKIKHKSPQKRKYSYLKSKEQEVYYQRLRLEYTKMPKKKEIKKPRIKKNQEGSLKKLLNRSSTRKGDLRGCLQVLLHFQSKVFRCKKNICFVPRSEVLQGQDFRGIQHCQGIQP